jgi:hypothetical protein
MKKKVDKSKAKPLSNVSDYRHQNARRVNIPPAKIAAEGTIPKVSEAQYSYSPRRPPTLRFDQQGKPDALLDLLGQARQRTLTEEEARRLAEALRIHEPWLEWAGKREAKSFEVDPVALMIHERISTQAILRVAARQDVQRDLFADPEMAYHEAVQFYQHAMDWTNRLILGDSLQVMSSLARREDLAGKVQMIYMDPPYGIKFASNFQPEIGKRDVKDREQDLIPAASSFRSVTRTSIACGACWMRCLVNPISAASSALGRPRARGVPLLIQHSTTSFGIRRATTSGSGRLSCNGLQKMTPICVGPNGRTDFVNDFPTQPQSLQRRVKAGLYSDRIPLLPRHRRNPRRSNSNWGASHSSQEREDGKRTCRA